MRIVNTLYDFEFNFNENEIMILTIENPEIYSNLLRDLWSQYEGGDGSFIFSDNEKEIKLSSKAECVYNLFSIDCNSKKIISNLAC
jgi:CRISPR type II-A-associated protein Csn2